MLHVAVPGRWAEARYIFLSFFPCCAHPQVCGVHSYLCRMARQHGSPSDWACAASSDLDLSFAERDSVFFLDPLGASLLLSSLAWLCLVS